ncbi:MAG: STAS/SEC14 domain-containing protein [Bacteroidetes bacterium]|nr:STAS/SEC14 domain-containing protein [Bacteroidota bacterium]
MKAVQGLEIIRTRNSEIWLDEEGILRLKPIKGGDIDLDEARACFEVYKKLGCDKKKVLQLIDASEGAAITHEGREYASQHGRYYFIASAIVGTSLAVRLIVNFFNSFYKQPVPFKLFSNEEDALKWLRSFRK